MKKLLFTLFTFTFYIGFGQHLNLGYGVGFGGASIDAGKSICYDNNENVIVTGYFQGTTDLDPTVSVQNHTSNGSSDIFISKLDNNGNLIWAKTIGGSNLDQGTGIITDDNDNIYVTGFFRDIVDFDPGIGVSELTSNGVNDFFLLKLDTDGNFVWAISAGGSGTDNSNGIAIDSGGNIILTGVFQNTVDFDPSAGTNNVTSIGNYDPFIVKFDSDGNLIWANSIGGSTDDDRGMGIEVDANDNIIATGWYKTNTGDFNPGLDVFTLPYSNSLDVYVAKYTSTGDFIWANSISGIDEIASYSIDVDLDGNVYVAGTFVSTANFDPIGGGFLLTSNGSRDGFISKYDLNGVHQWALNFGSVWPENLHKIVVDNAGGLYVAGYFVNSIEFIPGPVQDSIESSGLGDIYIASYNDQGLYRWGKSIGSSENDILWDMAIESTGKIAIIGEFNGTIDANPEADGLEILSNGLSDVIVGTYSPPKIWGNVYSDYNENCIYEEEFGEMPLEGINVLITPGNIVAQTGPNGDWFIDSLPSGTYTITYDTLTGWGPTCGTNELNFNVLDGNGFTQGPSMGYDNLNGCSEPNVSIFAPSLRRCFNNRIIYVEACNAITATQFIPSAYVEVELDPSINIDAASMPFSIISPNLYRFDIGDVEIGECINFTLNTTVSCSGTWIGQTLCMEAELFPVDLCMLDSIPATSIPQISIDPDLILPQPCTLPWDKSSLQVNGWCADDSVHFSITNTGDIGEGDMECYSPVLLYINDTLVSIDSIQIQGQQTVYYSYPADGETWILHAEQHPLHPGNSHPNAHVEACGSTLTNWIPEMINNQPLDDADPIKDIYCGTVTGSYDPNDKTGYPLGISNQNFIFPNQQLQYVIRFQNTGNDTAFTVVIRDTLDFNLNIFSIESGVASHNYQFEMYGPRVLQWTFNNILLPDSTTNEAESHGFVTFTVDQIPDLPNGTLINNNVGIYFDFNDPIITNTTNHEINDMILSSPLELKENILGEDKIYLVYPNPNNGSLFIECENYISSIDYLILDLNGREVISGRLNQKKELINLQNLKPGLYILQLDGNISTRIIKQ